MGFNCGIVGLPNVGKSTLFNALTATQAAEASNFPFCTIEPNIGRVAVHHKRLYEIHRIAKSKTVIPAQVGFVDIAGLVKGASKGEGLGNKFLGHIREVDAIAHVVRCYESDEVTHVEASVDPIRDAEIIETELMIADLEAMERRIEPIAKKAAINDKAAKEMMTVMQPVLDALREGRPARDAAIPEGREDDLEALQLLTSKPVMYIANVDEASAATGNELSARLAEKAAGDGSECVVISAAIEAEIAGLSDPEEAQEFLASLGLEEPGLDRVKQAGYDLLGLITFFTSGPNESRAWTVPRGIKAAQAAGKIHTDFERGFIRAETIAYDDFVACGGEQGARDAGKMRSEGRDYIIKDGDVILFRFNV
ncbi:MAG TPA: redox-regulated ATPase YchF [Alphaproteobacteria bacterium]|nr:redox-regulated ATPase YchF [Alphaproteobacteria bacterium]